MMDIRLKFAGYCQDCDVWQEHAESKHGYCTRCLYHDHNCLCDETCKICDEPLSDDDHIDDDIHALTICEINSAGSWIKILEHSFNGCNSYSLIWGDYVVNEWRESFDVLSHAMLRLAVLIDCREHSWLTGFATHGEQFDSDASQFIANQVTAS